MLQSIPSFQSKILSRYETHQRSLPWRDSFDEYQVFVSETMSQQTQVDRVVPKFLQFISEVPDFQTLADLDKPTLLRLWSGLGFNSRAIRLQQSAQRIMMDYGGRVPRDRDELQSLPGVGPYMSASVLAFAFNIASPVVDTNIRRVLIWELGLHEKISLRELELIAEQCIPEGKSNDRHNALMDYGSLVATAKFTGIRPVGKQSKFKGSDREVRGWILKQLTKNIALTKDIVYAEFPTKDVSKIVLGMKKEGLIGVRGEELMIAE